MSFLYGGVNLSLAGNGGPDCYDYIPLWQRLAETALFVPFAVFVAVFVQRRLHMPKVFVERTISRRQHRIRRYILCATCVVFGAEIGYKMATGTAIFLLNPCHVTTSMQIYLLLADPSGSPTSCWVFRLHLYTAGGATLALLFPVTDSRLLPYEVFVYYAQHVLILAIPMYLVTFKGAFSAEPLTDITWPILSWAITLIYCFVPLQILGLITKMNLINMVCPAPCDPFIGPHWRTFTVIHQMIYIPMHGKIMGILSRTLMTLLKPYRTDRELTPPESPVTSKADKNGHFDNQMAKKWT